jgi:peptidoglycan/LPS O-acetylase OafA/YrhL
MRGIAAIIVLLIHCLHLQTDTANTLTNAFVAVDFFFILSGFVICHAYAEKLEQGMTFREYLARRIGRLYPLMAIGLLLGVPHLYHQVVAAPTDYTRRDLLVTLICNLAMLPYFSDRNSITPHGVFPTDAAIWSIAFEILASFTFPFLLRLDNKRLGKFCVAWLAVLVVASVLRGYASFTPPLFRPNAGFNVTNFIGGFPRVFFGFSCGMLLYRLSKDAAPWATSLKPANPWLLYAALTGLLVYPHMLIGLYSLFAIAVVAPLLVFIGSFSPCHDRVTLRVSEFLGWLSYPLYCVHTPVIDVVDRVYAKTDILTRAGIPETAATLTAAIIFSIGVGWLIDKLQVQRALTRLLAGTHRPAPRAAVFPASELP